MTHVSMRRAAAVAVISTTALAAAHAADWSDTSIGYRYGTKFAEPFNTQDISKNIFNLNHVSGYKYGTNFFNVDLLLSDKKDPSSATSKAVVCMLYPLLWARACQASPCANRPSLRSDT